MMTHDHSTIRNRRRFLAGSLLTLAAPMLGTLSGCSRDRGKRQLRIFVYAGAHEETMRQVFVPAFEAATGAEVILDAGWWDAIAKLKTSPKNQPAFDLMITDATQGIPAIRAGLFQTLDATKLPNVQRLAESVKQSWIWKERHAVPYPDAVMTLAYHRPSLPTEPTRWADLLRPELRGRVGLYDAYYMSLYTFACMMVSEANRPGTAQQAIRTQLDEVLRYAKTHRDQVGYWWPTTSAFASQLAQKQYPIGNMQSPEMLQLLAANPELGAVVPAEDRAFVQVMWAIPDGTPNADLAHQAIDWLFADSVQRGLAERGSATAILPVAQAMASADPRWASLYPSTEEGLAAIQVYPYDLYAEHGEEISTFWDREVLRKAAS
ncbi:ABC transporter substrate-binding protein [Tuwongella immobilis]|nr:extracellular solute-binding protein [Tuwongella immobilis]